MTHEQGRCLDFQNQGEPVDRRTFVKGALAGAALSMVPGFVKHAVGASEIYLPRQEVRTTPLEGTVALTFDDGPHIYDLAILDLLDKYDIKATWFVIGSNISRSYQGALSNGEVVRYEDILQEIVARGHSLQNHTWSHYDITKLRDARIIEELESTTEEIEAKTGVVVTCMRPPQYRTNTRTTKLIKEKLGLEVIGWELSTIDSGDYALSAVGVANRLAKAGASDNITLHSWKQTRSYLAVLEDFIAKMLSENIGFSTIGEIQENAPRGPQPFSWFKIV